VRATQVRINTANLRHNLHCVAQAAPGCRTLAVIKANGYGHGLLRCAHALSAADAFAVASCGEAIALRNAGIEQPILLLEGFFAADELAAIVQRRLDIVVHHLSQIALLEKFSADHAIHVWLKIDSGMHRLGFLPAQVKAAWQRLRACSCVAPNIRLLTHLACADNPGSDATLQQLDCFDRVAAALPRSEQSIANSAALLAWPQSHRDWLRPGLMLYGASPFSFPGASDHPFDSALAQRQPSPLTQQLKPVMTFTSNVIAIKHLQKGDKIGYDGSWRCPEAMPVAIVAAGYGDGYPRHASAGTPVLLNGQRTALIGRVSMDMLCIDLRSQPGARLGDPVTLWGEGLPVEEVARHAGTIPYELLCGITSRVDVVECS